MHVVAAVWTPARPRGLSQAQIEELVWVLLREVLEEVLGEVLGVVAEEMTAVALLEDICRVCGELNTH
jgi:hypothetical protein